MLLSKAAQKRADSRHLNAVEPSGAQTWPPRLNDLFKNKNINMNIQFKYARIYTCANIIKNLLNNAKNAGNAS